MKGNPPSRGSSGRAGPREIDLHLKPAQAAADVIERQIARFRGELDGARRRGDREIVFIHGVGSGRLKEEIRRILKEEYPACLFQDAPFSRYGYGGATLVTIRK